MKTVSKVAVLGVVLALQSCASAETKPVASNSPMKCAMMADTDAMQKNMGSMMSDMDAMMKGMSDPAQKAKMQNMHEQMSTMMAHMKKMGGGMGMMGGMSGHKEGPTPAPSASPSEDHEAHHPK